jgi:RNA polymerase sigma-70 factor (ECF subfamily)
VHLSQPTYSEKELLLQVANGDERAFAVLFGQWYPLLSTLLLRITRSEIVAREVVQDVFLKIWMGREALVHVHHFKSYLWVIAKRQAIDALRRKAIRTAHETSYSETHTSTHTDPAAPADYYTLIDEAVAQLPPQQQRVYLLSRRQRLKQAEIAALMNISLATVKSYMQLAIASVTRYIRENAGLELAVLIASLFYY